MKCIKIVSLLLMIILFSYACSENGISTNRSGDKTTANVGNKKTDIPSSSQDSIRYDDLPDLADFVINGREWNHTNLTYYFSNGTAEIAGDQEQQALKDAMDYWADVTPLTFTEVSAASQADIIILWATGAHGDGSPFDGINGILAHAFYPPPNNGSYAGDVHFDDAENWTLSTRSTSNQPIDLTSVAAHELGHSLGLGHSQDQDALMYPFYSGSHRYLSQDDIDGIQNIYGAPPPPNPLIVSITGSRFLNPLENGTWTANVSNNKGAVSYQWRLHDPPNPNNAPNHSGASENVDSSTYGGFFTNYGTTWKRGSVSVKVISAGEIAKATFYVHVYASCNNGGYSARGDSVSANNPQPCN